MIHSFLLIGQSNMAGRGYIADAHEIDTSHIRILRNCRWQGMFRPIHCDRSFAGVSLAESFAERYAAKYGVDAGLICCADGGTRLDQWKKGSLLFENAVFHAKAAQKTSVLSGILWHQGESDCSAELYPTYKERFEQFRKDLCDELDAHHLPFLIGGLGDFLADCPLDAHLKNYALVNEALQKIARDNPRVGYVSAERLGSNPDHLHFSAEALYEFGVRYFNEYVRLNDSPASGRDCITADEHRTAMELL